MPMPGMSRSAVKSAWPGTNSIESVLPCAIATAPRKTASLPGRGRLEKRGLAVQARRDEEGGVQRVEAVARVQPEARACLVEALAQQLGEQALARHARAEVGVVVAAVAHLVDARHHVRGLQREVRL